MTIRKYAARMRIGKTILALVAAPMLFWASAAQSAALTSGNVNYVGTYGNGNVFILLSATVAEPGCNAARVDIVGTHPSIKLFLATAMGAMASGRPILVSTTGCFAFSTAGGPRNYPTIDASNDGFISIAP